MTDVLEERARELARALAGKLPAPTDSRGLWYTDPDGRPRATPVQLTRVAAQTTAVTDLVDFVKRQVGRGRWPRREGEQLVEVFEALLAVGDPRERIRAARRLAEAIAAEYLYASAPQEERA